MRVAVANSAQVQQIWQQAEAVGGTCSARGFALAAPALIDLTTGRDGPIALLADAQHGVVAHWQLTALRYGVGAIRRRLEQARLHRAYKGVYAVGRSRLTARGRWTAAVLAYGPAAMVSHRTAAALLDLRPAGPGIDLTLPGPGRRSRPPIVAHRTERLDPEERVTIDNIPGTSVPRTILDLASILNRPQLLRVLEQADRSGALNHFSLQRALSRASGRRRQNLESLLAAYRAPPPVRSELERRFLELIEAAGIRRPRVNQRVSGLEVDFLWPQARLVVELDGRGYHSSPRAFEQDRVRDARLLAAGYRVLRITYRRLGEDPAGVIADLLAVLAASPQE